MTTYLITGATGLIGRHLLTRILRDPSAEVHALVRPQSAGRLQRALAEIEGSERVHPLPGDLTTERLGVTDRRRAALRGKVDHLVHLAALYDMTASDERNDEVNVEGTRRVVELAEDLRVGVLHHVSSVAVAGDATGTFSEDDFDQGQPLPSPYHRTKFESERIVRGVDRAVAGVPALDRAR